MVPFDSLSKTALEINLFGIARLDSTMLPYMVTLVTIYGNRCMGGRERSSEDHVIGVVFDEETHGNIRFYSFGRRYTVLKQTPRMPWHPPVSYGDRSDTTWECSFTSVNSVSLSRLSREIKKYLFRRVPV